MKFIRYWCETIAGVTSYRFSGGEPTLLGDRLFRLADIGYKLTGLRPFILTAGKELNKEWVLRARESAIAHIFVSIENPIQPDKGAPDPNRVVDFIREFNSPTLPIVPGVCVVPNNCFKHLPEICNWFYTRLGRIPPLCEVNYSPYKCPSEIEWEDLKKVLPTVIRDHFHNTQLNIFSSIVPEYAYGGKDPYVFDLDLENTQEINGINYKRKQSPLIRELNTVHYPRLHCLQKNCPWKMFCKNTKWYWQNDKNGFEKKITDYCRFKRILSDAYYRVIVGPSHPDTTCSIKLS